MEVQYIQDDNKTQIVITNPDGSQETHDFFELLSNPPEGLDVMEVICGASASAWQQIEAMVDTLKEVSKTVGEKADL